MAYSALSLLKGALTGNRSWRETWRKAEPKRAYDVVIIGGGGHGLATAFYLAENHGIRNVAGAGRGLCRRRQCRTQHDDRALRTTCSTAIPNSPSTR